MSENGMEKPTDRLPMKQRNLFQLKVFEILNILHDMDNILDCRKAISDYIDNPENEETREVIINGNDEDYKKEAVIMIEKLGLKKRRLARAA